MNPADMQAHLETLAREFIAEQDAAYEVGTVAGTVRRDASGVRHVMHVIADRAPKGQGVTFGMCEAAARKVVLG